MTEDGRQKQGKITVASSTHVLHEDGDHQCLVPYSPVREGEDLRGKSVWSRQEDGTYEPFDVGALHGPAQVASPAYREGWDATFGSVHSTGGAA